jgi:[ribosomal protein S5]-alanine N-acetyltransferase
MIEELFLEGAHLLLRPVSANDVTASYIRWMSDPLVNRYMETRFREHTEDNIRDFVETMRRDRDICFMAIIHKQDGSHIGNIKLGPVSRIHGRGEISFFIGEKLLWGKGLASEAVSLLTEFGLSQRGLQKVTAGAYSNNIGSIRVFEKCGFIREAVMRSHYICEGERVDRICFARFREKHPDIS